MTRVFIVDDEEIIRDGLKNLIPWSDINSEVVGVAENGEEAFGKIKELKPDIVFSDIKMPKLDGLQLTEKLQIIMPDIKIVFLTGYDDFDYARQAVQLSVKDYILKPINPDKLIECIKSLNEAIEKEKREQLEEEAVRKQLVESLPYMKAWFLNLLEQEDHTNLWNKLGFLGIDLYKGFFQVANINIENTENDNEKPFLIFKILEGIKSLLNNLEVKFIVFIENEIITIILSYPINLVKTQVINKTFILSNMVTEFLDYNYKRSYTIGLGIIVDNICDISRSYFGAVNACKYKFYMGDNKTIYIKDVEPIKEKRKYDLAVGDKFAIAIKVGDTFQINKMLQQLFKDMTEQRENISTVRMVCYELLIQALRATYEIGERLDVLLSEKDTWYQINNMTTIEQLYRYITEFMASIVNYLLRERESKNKKLVEVVKSFIKENYHKNISLESVANEIHLSPCYLSTLFSREVGKTFKDYLIHTRIEKSKILLADMNIKIYEVSERVGYSDSHYFSQIFKKHTGFTPANYRNTQIF